MRIAGGSLVLGIASVLLAASTSFPVSLALMIAIGAGGITMAATANATIQLAVPDGLRGRVMSVYTTVFAGSVPIGGIAAGALASAVGVPLTLAISGLLSLAVGAGAFVWWRRIGSPSPASLGASATPAAVEMTTEAATSQSTAPSTRAAFKPPNPNEVLSTRR